MEKTLEQYQFIIEKLSSGDSKIDYKENLSMINDINNPKVSCIVYLEINRRLNDEKTFHVFFTKCANIELTSKYIKERLKRQLKLQGVKVCIYITRGKRKTDYSIENVRKSVNATSVEYIEDTIKNISINRYGITFDNEKYESLKAFVFPSIESINIEDDNIIEFEKEEDFINNFLDRWYEKEESPILFVKGDGGIGKTTIAYYISNYLLSKDINASHIFINSIEAKKGLISNFRDQDFIELYDLYKASKDNNETFLNDLIFSYNLDAGNFFIVIDGIDELISKVENFDINSFMKSIEKFNTQLNNSKVIITCRSHFLDKSLINDQSYEILGIKSFDLKRVKSFFSKSFDGDKGQIDKALNMAIDFHKNDDGADFFHPYALDLITKIISIEANTKDNPNTTILIPSLTTDYIISKICHRENYLDGSVRILDLNIDEQIKIFQKIAINYHGELNSKDYKEILKNIVKSEIKKNTSDSLIDAFCSHPLLAENSKGIKFSYDFLTDFFKGTYGSDYLLNIDMDYPKTTEIINLLTNCWFGSPLVDDISKRMKKKWMDWDLGKVGKTFSTLKFQIDIDDFDNKKDYYCGLFNLLIGINIIFGKNDKRHNTKVIDIVYGEKEINNLYIENINVNIIFDFSSKCFKKCKFINFPYFWECEWNECDKFIQTNFQRLGVRNTKESPFAKKEETFNDCDWDQEFLEQIEKPEEIDNLIKSHAANVTQRFIRFFYNDHRIRERDYSGKEDSFVNTFSTIPKLHITLKDFEDILANLYLLDKNTDNKNNITINIAKKYRSDIISAMQNGSFCEIMYKLSHRLFIKEKEVLLTAKEMGSPVIIEG